MERWQPGPLEGAPAPRSGEPEPFPLETGTCEHYEDADLYDFEYRRRRADVTFYRGVASEIGTAPILELGCGSGRVLVPLIRDGRQVLGLDRSRSMLERAARRLDRLPKRRAAAQLLLADFKALCFRARFSLVVCPFNAFQHLYTRHDVQAALTGVRQAMAPGGRFVFDVMNPDLRWLAQSASKRWARTRFHHPRTGEALTYSTHHVYDRASQVNYIYLYYESQDGGPARAIRLAHRIFFPAELEALLAHAGFRLVARYGDFGYGPLVQESEQQVCVAEIA